MAKKKNTSRHITVKVYILQHTTLETKKTRTLPKAGSDLGFSGRVSRFFSTCGNRGGHSFVLVVILEYTTIRITSLIFVYSV